MVYSFAFKPSVTLKEADNAIRSSKVIEKIESLLSQKNKRARPDQLIYFYFSFDDAQHQDLETLLKSTIAQLCPRDDVLTELRKTFQDNYPARLSYKQLRSMLISSLKRLSGTMGHPWDRPKVLKMVLKYISSSMALMRSHTETQGTTFSTSF